MTTAEDPPVNSELGKRKRDPTEQVNGRAIFEEFLHVMQPPSKSKIWSNEDLVRQPEAARSTLSSPSLNIIGDRDYGNHEIMPKKFKNTLQPHQDRELLYSLEENPTTATTLMPQNDSISEAPSLLLDQELPVTTDEVWLRSRTSNLVDVDSTDNAMPLNGSLGTDVSTQKSIITNQLSESAVSGSSIQAEAVPGSQLSNSAVSVGHATGRIFVRNLAYGSAEEDLREYFSSQGSDSVQEVRSIASYTFYHVFRSIL